MKVCSDSSGSFHPEFFDQNKNIYSSEIEDEEMQPGTESNTLVQEARERLMGIYQSVR